MVRLGAWVQVWTGDDRELEGAGGRVVLIERLDPVFLPCRGEGGGEV